MRLKAHYPALPILITENGIPDETSDLPVDDPYRVSFLRDHFVQASRAIADGSLLEASYEFYRDVIAANSVPLA